MVDLRQLSGYTLMSSDGIAAVCGELTRQVKGLEGKMEEQQRRYVDCMNDMLNYMHHERKCRFSVSDGECTCGLWEVFDQARELGALDYATYQREVVTAVGGAAAGPAKREGTGAGENSTE